MEKINLNNNITLIDTKWDLLPKFIKYEKLIPYF